MGIDAILDDFIAQEVLPSSYKEFALNWFIPVAEKIARHHNSAGKPILVGLNGAQGSGKSTLCALLCQLLSKHYQKPCLGMSIDDFYLGKAQRISKAKEVHALFATRGVPGTHNTDLLLDTIGKLKQGQSALVSRFDKSLDDLYPTEQWHKIDTAHDIIILEGWCVGISPQNEADLSSAINSLESDKDNDGVWRQSVNKALSGAYADAFSLIDFHIMLKCPSFEAVYEWRCEQEHKLIDKLTTKQAVSDGSSHSKPLNLTGIMNDEQISEFIQYYERLTVHALKTMPSHSDIVFELNKARDIVDSHYQ